MQNMCNRETALIFLGITFQSFCSLGLIFFEPLTISVTSKFFNTSTVTTFTLSWIVLTFFSRIFGSYIFGRYSESEGFLKTQKILTNSYVVTAILLCICCLFFSHLYEAKHILLLVACLNIFLFPATLVPPSIYLMKKTPVSLHTNISALTILAALIGHSMSYCVFHYLVKNNLKSMSIIFIFASFSCLLVYLLGKKFWLHSKKVITEKTQSPSTHLEKIMTWLIGVVSGAGLTHHYFFLRPYRQNVLIVDNYTYEYLYFLFYAMVAVCLAIYYFLHLSIDKLKLMKLSAICLLTLSFSFSLVCECHEAVYAIYQFLFALFLSNFLAPALGLIFSFFRNDQPFFNSLFWFYSGVSLSFLSSYLLNNQYVPLHRYFLFISPLVFGGFLFLICTQLIPLFPNVTIFKKMSINKLG